MSGADLFEDGFPHGTKEGYAQGCRGSACPTGLELGLSCRDANTRYHADYGFRKAVDRGASVAELAPGKPHVRPVVKRRGGRLLTYEEDVVNAAQTRTRGSVPKPGVPRVRPADLVRPVPREEESVSGKKELRPEQHGTAYGYRQGCRDGGSCPGLEGERGRSCVQAMAAWAESVKAANASRLADRKPLEPVSGVPVADDVQEPEIGAEAGAGAVSDGVSADAEEPAEDDEVDPVVAAAVDTAGVAVQELRERFSKPVEPSGREHGGLYEDLRVTRRQRDEAREESARLRAQVEDLELKLSARAVDQVPVEGPVTVHALYTEGRLSSLRVEVPQSA